MSANSTNIAIRLVLAVSAMLLVAPCSMAQNTADTASAITVDGKESISQVVDAQTEQEESAINPKEIIFEHLGDGYGWEVPFNHHVRIPLPVIVWGTDGLHIFSSSRLTHGEEYVDGKATFKIAGKDSPHKGKVVEIVDGKEIKPLDVSITKNVCALFITVILVLWAVLSVARWHKTHGHKAPRKMVGFMELLIMFVYDA